MADKYRQRLLRSSGVSNIRFQSEYARKLMSQMGWKGNGLGKNQHGETECVQIQRREESAGLGRKALGGADNWKDQWWNDAYNNSIKKLHIRPRKHPREESSSDDSSEDSSDSSTSSVMPSLFQRKSKPIAKPTKSRNK